jgi:hypothetical protein
LSCPVGRERTPEAEPEADVGRPQASTVRMPVGQEPVLRRYRLGQRLGSGGFGVVWSAWDEKLEREVAVKVIRRDGGDARIVREARAAARLNHPGIVGLYELTADDDSLYLVSELVRGRTLAELERARALSDRDVARIGVALCDALAHAHERGVIHRDVKPQNVVVDGGRATMTDFGLARASGGDGITLTGTVMGTSDYISPEQARGLPADSRSDVYSLGALLYELLTGEVPFPGDNSLTVAMDHSNGPVPSVAARRPDVPMRVDAAVGRAMEKRPTDRFSTMDEFVAELERCLAEVETREDGEPTVILRPARRPRPRRAAVWAVLAAVALAAAIGATVLLQHRGGAASGVGLQGPSAPSHAHLQATAAYDPQGDGSEHDERLAQATDGDLSSYWETEHYSSPDFGNLKPGVGLVLDAGAPVRLSTIQLATDTPGFTAEIQAGDSPTGSFSSVSDSKTVGNSTRFSLDASSPKRYYLVWITALPTGGEAHVNEVRAAE